MTTTAKSLGCPEPGCTYPLLLIQTSGGALLLSDDHRLGLDEGTDRFLQIRCTNPDRHIVTSWTTPITEDVTLENVNDNLTLAELAKAEGLGPKAISDQATEERDEA